MGHTLEKLAEKEIEQKSIFNHRFVVEICEKVHTHYRNLRIIQSLDDFITMADGFNQAVERWKKRGCPGTGKGVHIELVRKQVAQADESKTIQVNLNDNLYKKNEGSIYSEGAGFNDEKYVHVKVRDLRLEMSINEFKELADVIKQASERLENSSIASSVS
jgi:hypothetical protein